MGDLVDKIEQALPKALGQYLDKIEYGKLFVSGWRVAGNEHLNIPSGSVQWSLKYYFLFEQADYIFLFLTPTNQLIIQNTKNRIENATLKDLVPIISQIPERRREEIGCYSKNYPDNPNFLEALIATCRRENCEPTDLYSEEELAFARSLK